MPGKHILSTFSPGRKRQLYIDLCFFLLHIADEYCTVEEPYRHVIIANIKVQVLVHTLVDRDMLGRVEYGTSQTFTIARIIRIGLRLLYSYLGNPPQLFFLSATTSIVDRSRMLIDEIGVTLKGKAAEDHNRRGSPFRLDFLHANEA